MGRFGRWTAEERVHCFNSSKEQLTCPRQACSQSRRLCNTLGPHDFSQGLSQAKSPVRPTWTPPNTLNSFLGLHNEYFGPVPVIGMPEATAASGPPWMANNVAYPVHLALTWLMMPFMDSGQGQQPCPFNSRAGAPSILPCGLVMGHLRVRRETPLKQSSACRLSDNLRSLLA